MLAKIIQQICKTQARSFTTSSSKGVSVQFKMISSRSVDQFFNIYQQHTEQFDGEIFSSSYRVLLGHLRNDRESSLHFTEVDQFMNGVFAIKVDSLTCQQIPNILGLIWALGRKFSYGYITNPKVEEMLSRFVVLLEENQHLDVSFCCFALNEVSHFNYSFVPFKMLAEKIVALARDVKLSSFQMSLVLNAIHNSGILSVFSRQLRNLILMELGSIYKSLKLPELAQLSCDINKFNEHTWSGLEKKTINEIYQNLLQKASELDEKSVFSIVSVPTIEHYSLFLTIDEINRNVINEFQIDGSCGIEKNFILKVLFFLNKHVKVFREGNSEKKIFAVLKAKQEEADSEGLESGKAFTFGVQKLISTRFFQLNHMDRLKQLLQGRMAYMSNQAYFSLANIGLMMENDYVEFLESSPNSDRTDKEIFALAALILYLEKFPENSVLKKHFAFSTSHFESNFENEEKFMKAFSQSSNYKKTSKCSALKVINDHFDSRMLNLLPCPFEGALDWKIQLKYVMYIVFFLKRDAQQKQLNRIKPLMSFQLKERLLNFYAREKNLDNEKINWWLNFFSSNFDEFVQSGRVSVFRDMFKSLELVQLSISKREIQGNTVNKYYKVLRLIVLNQDKISQFFKQLRFFLSVVLTTSMKKYNYEVDHRKMIFFCINRLSTFSNMKELVVRILREGLRMNVLEARHLEGLKVVDYAQNRSIFGQIQILQGDFSLESMPKPFPIKANDIEIILKSGDIEWIATHEEQIINVIQSNNRKNQLINYLINFSIPLTIGAGRKILKIIADNFVENVLTFEGTDLVSLLSNLKKNNLLWSRESRNIVEHVIDILQNKFNGFNMNTHIEIVKLVAQSPNITIQLYGEGLIRRLNSKYQQQKSKIELYYNLASSGFSFENVDLSNISNFYQSERAIALETFLLLENILPAEEKKTILAKIIQNIQKSESDEEDQEFSELNVHYYNYLVKHYPEETKNLDISKLKFKEAYPLLRVPSDNFEQVLNAITKVTGKTFQIVPVEGESGSAYLVDGVHLLPIENYKINGKLCNNLIERILMDKTGFPKVASFSSRSKNAFFIVKSLKDVLSLNEEQEQKISKELTPNSKSQEEEEAEEL